MVKGGREAARENLDWLWSQVGAVADPALNAWLAMVSPDVGLVSRAIAHSPSFAAADAFSRLVSPYALGPLYENPLERIVRHFDYDRVRTEGGPELFVCATNVRTGKIRVFSKGEITPEAIMASACLPTMFQAVEITDPETGVTDGYWDGGYTGNPALFPLYDPSLPNDIVVVNINPLERKELPRSAPEILNRINEISFNSTLFRELRAIQFVHDLIAQGKLESGAMKDVLIHMIADDELMNRLSVATKLVPNPVVLAELKAAGQAAADGFLRAHKQDIGKRATADLRAMFS